MKFANFSVTIYLKNLYVCADRYFAKFLKLCLFSQTLKIGETTRTHAFCHKTWTGAEKLYRSNGPVHMGRQFLIKEIFDEDELRDATPTGRRMRGQAPGEEKQLDENRQWQILGRLSHVKFAHE